MNWSIHSSSHHLPYLLLTLRFSSCSYYLPTFILSVLVIILWPFTFSVLAHVIKYQYIYFFFFLLKFFSGDEVSLTPESSPELTKRSWFGTLMGSERDETYTILVKGKPLASVKADLIHAFLSVSLQDITPLQYFFWPKTPPPFFSFHHLLLLFLHCADCRLESQRCQSHVF